MFKTHKISHRFSGNALVYSLFGLVVLVIAFLVIDNTILKDAPKVTAENSIQSSIEVTEKSSEPVVEEKTAVLHNSIAVLPFENLSPSPNDAYFAIGIHQEILDHLVKIRDINSISRASVLHYENAVTSIAEIASELNVETVMKGSVSYSNNQININVELFDTSDNSPLWSEQYDRELSDIFEIEAEIVERIALILSAELTADEQQRIEKVPTRSLEAYALYLNAHAVPSIIGPVRFPEFYHYLDQAIELDPDFALAHSVKARGYAFAKRNGRQIDGLSPEEMESKAIEHSDIALALDPDLIMIYMAQAELHRSQQREAEASLAYERALQLNPNDREILSNYARSLSAIGKHDDAAQVSMRVIELDPNEANNHYLLAGRLMYAGKPVAAAAKYRQAISMEPNFFRYLNLSIAEILSGNNSEAHEAIQYAEKLISDNTTTRGIARVAFVYSKLGLHDDAMRVFNLLESTVANGKLLKSHARTLSFLAIGEIDKAFDVLSEKPVDGLTPLQEIKSNMLNVAVLEEPRFLELRKLMQKR